MGYSFVVFCRKTDELEDKMFRRVASWLTSPMKPPGDLSLRVSETSEIPTNKTSKAPSPGSTPCSAAWISVLRSLLLLMFLWLPWTHQQLRDQRFGRDIPSLFQSTVETHVNYTCQLKKPSRSSCGSTLENISFWSRVHDANTEFSPPPTPFTHYFNM